MSDKEITRKQFIMLLCSIVLVWLAKSIPSTTLNDAVARGTSQPDGYGNNSYGGSRHS